MALRQFGETKSIDEIGFACLPDSAGQVKVRAVPSSSSVFVSKRRTARGQQARPLNEASPLSSRLLLPCCCRPPSPRPDLLRVPYPFAGRSACSALNAVGVAVAFRRHRLSFVEFVKSVDNPSSWPLCVAVPYCLLPVAWSLTRTERGKRG